ncbi:hypothetical protein [Serpentinicella alkaliphila]|uniref:Uncharacterized protein n=1 Tax=Serpentinicella alkaliphila TaxID=1734049 RepID=A0A4R2TF05_9FIRM|nr:hypothetical protein [Serpentinicella alkaliphila]QUH26009.1 hypothetical protein HZR23_09875 [Serpentinicella alkaliphila]TCQ02130.1 hypothetical protein EDD79_101810 [Serpentinicella alkaliphila]
MAEIFLALLVAVYIFYIVAFQIPNQIKSIEEKIDILKLNIHEVQIRINEISRKLDDK